MFIFVILMILMFLLYDVVVWFVFIRLDMIFVKFFMKMFLFIVWGGGIGVLEK